MTLLSDKILLPSHPQSIRDLENFLNPVLFDCSSCKKIYSRILISLTEAVNNAIHHGNQCNKEKMVEISFQYKQNEYIRFIISDEGQGFDPDCIPDPTQHANCHKEGGRGVFLMKNLADKISYYDCGRKVEMLFIL